MSKTDPAPAGPASGKTGTDGAPTRRDARIAGALGTAAGLLAMWIFSSLVAEAKFPPAALGDALIRAAPGDLATFFIESLQHWAMRLLTAGVVLLAIAAGAELVARTTVTAAALFLGGFAALAAILAPGGSEYAPSFFNAAVGAVVFWRVTELVLRPLREPHTADDSRRRTLKLALGGIGALAVAGAAASWIARRLGGPDTNVGLVAPAEAAAIPEREPFPDIEGLTPEITSASDHYVVDINLFPPSVEAEGWTLKVNGEVETPLELTFQQLQEKFEVVEEYAVLVCVSNEIGGHLIGNSAWGGVRLADVLEEAGVKPGAVDVVFRAADGYSDSIPLDMATRPFTILAVSQNGKPLEQDHGFPCRVRVPAIYGMKNVKWLQEIEVVSSDYKGYWQNRGWSDTAVIKTESRIDVAGNDHQASVGESVWIAGIAWAGDRGISKVEVSTDGGQTWQEAMVKEPVAPLAWRQWAYRWTPGRRGEAVIACRATDREGSVQTAEQAPPHPNGASGYHEVTVEVT